MTASDPELVRHCLAGDANAIRSLVECFQGDVYGLCLRMLSQRQDAEDVVQEVFLRVFRSLKSWDASRPLRPWIMTIAVNRCRTWLARRSQRPQAAELTGAETAREPADDSREMADAVQAAVDQLREEFKTVFVLYHERGLSYESIAEIIERPVGTVKTWLHRARVLVYDHLKLKGLIPATIEEAGS